MDKIPGSFRNILNSEVSQMYSLVFLFMNNFLQAKMLLEERIRENKINVLTNNNNNNNSNSNNNTGSASVPVATGETVNSKFKLKNIIQAKVQCNSVVSSLHCDRSLSQIIDVDKADPLTGLVSWMKIETKQKTFEEKVPTVLGGLEYQV